MPASAPPRPCLLSLAVMLAGLGVSCGGSAPTRASDGAWPPTDGAAPQVARGDGGGPAADAVAADAVLAGPSAPEAGTAGDTPGDLTSSNSDGPGGGADAPAVTCRPLGAACTAGGCCDLASCLRGVCVASPPLGSGDACRESNQCDGGACVNGLCAVQCGLPNETCRNASGGFCCGGNCMAPRQPVCPAPIRCFATYSRCTADAQCCTQLCRDGLCKPPSCQPAGGKCTGNAECCRGLCARGAGGGDKCVDDCIPAGYRCSSSAQCCNNLCENGVCKLAPGICPFINGNSCNRHDECCSKNCVPAQPFPRCQPPG